MKTIIFSCLIFFLSFSPLSVLGQNGFFSKDSASNQYFNGFKHGNWIEYKDSSWHDTDQDHAVYYRLIVYEGGKPSGIVRDFFLSGQMQFEGKIVQLKPESKYDGLC